MEKEKLLEYISKEIKAGRNVDLDYVINQIPYKIRFQKQDFEKGIKTSELVEPKVGLLYHCVKK